MTRKNTDAERKRYHDAIDSIAQYELENYGKILNKKVVQVIEKRNKRKEKR